MFFFLLYTLRCREPLVFNEYRESAPKQNDIRTESVNIFVREKSIRKPTAYKATKKYDMYLINFYVFRLARFSAHTEIFGTN